jgi:hypothetical protein
VGARRCEATMRPSPTVRLEFWGPKKKKLSRKVLAFSIQNKKIGVFHPSASKGSSKGPENSKRMVGAPAPGASGRPRAAASAALAASASTCGGLERLRKSTPTVQRLLGAVQTGARRCVLSRAKPYDNAKGRCHPNSRMAAVVRRMEVITVSDSVR